jgi:Ni,Fe-hydrogenase III large subunit/intein/homing endonuclease
VVDEVKEERNPGTGAEGKEERETYSLPIGPQHPMYVEAENLNVHLDGETIVGVDVNIGYMHRGIEELMQRRNYLQNIYVSERICGICMPGDQEIILGDGSIVRISEVVDKKIPGNVSVLESSPITGYNTIAWNDGHCKTKSITHVQKVKSPGKLYRFRTKSGNELVFTGDHPIMIDTARGPAMVKSRDVRVGDWLYSPRKIDIESSPLRIIDTLPDDFKIVLKRNYYLRLREHLMKKHGSLAGVSKGTGIGLWRMWRMENRLRIFEMKKLAEFAGLDWDEASMNIKKVSRTGVTIDMRCHEADDEMMYVLGLIASDGYFGNLRPGGKNLDLRTTFVNKEKELISHVASFHRKWFPGKKVERIIMGSDTPAIRISNPVLSFVAQSLGLNSLSNRKTDMKPIFRLPEKEIAAFLGGYFDGDGSVNKKGTVMFYTSDKLAANRLHLLLKRVGIASSVSGSRSKGFKPGIRYSVSVTNMRDIQRFREAVSPRHPEKNRAISGIIGSKRKDTFRSFFQYAPRGAGPLIREMRKRYGIPSKDLCRVSDFAGIESGRKNAMKWRLSGYARKLKSMVPAEEPGITELEEMLSDRFHMDPVTKKEMIESYDEHVYDVSVDGVQNFIPGGAFVVSNCSGIHSMSYCNCVERLLDVEIPERAKHIRTIVLELERLHSHLLFLGIVGYEIGLDSVFMYVWRDREHVMDMLEMISGNRVNYAMPAIGGVRRDIPDHVIPGMLKKLDYLEKKSEYYRKVFLGDRTIIARTRGLGILPRKDVQDLSIVGPVARASGVKEDMRKDFPYFSYGGLDWSVMVKVLEMFQSISILRQCLRKLRGLDRELKVKVPLAVPRAEALSVTEAPRGELIYYAISNGTDRPERIRIRTPSFVNVVSAIPIILKGQQLADLPAIVASIDPCFSCTDRMTLTDARTGIARRVDEAYIKRMGERG